MFLQGGDLEQLNPFWVSILLLACKKEYKQCELFFR